MFKRTVRLRDESMSVYELARWASLMEAVDLIADKCEDRGIDFNSPVGGKYIKPLDIQDYVDSRTDSMVNTINRARDIERFRYIISNNETQSVIGIN